MVAAHLATTTSNGQRHSLDAAEEHLQRRLARMTCVKDEGSPHLLRPCVLHAQRNVAACFLLLSQMTSEKSLAMKIGIILETKEPEKAWNAFRFAGTAQKLNHEVKLFLLGEAVECEGLTHEKYDVDAQMKHLVELGGQLLACGTCLKTRKLEDSTECPVSTMVDCVNLVTWADRVVTF